MIERFFRLRLWLIFLSVKNLSSQVDDFRMRYEQDYAQLKSQEVAFVPQKVLSFTNEHSRHLHNNLRDLLNNQSGFYIVGQRIFSSDIYYQNRKLSPTIAVQNVDFSSHILDNNLQLIQTSQVPAYESIKIYQGYSTSQLQFNAGQISFDHAIEQIRNDTIHHSLHTSLGGGNQEYSGFIKYRLNKSKWSYLVNLYGGQYCKYKLGQNGVEKPWLNWQRIANPYNGSLLSSWSDQNDILANSQSQFFYGLENLIHLKPNRENEWKIYLHASGQQETDIGSTIQRENEYLLSEASRRVNSRILAFIQKINYSESSPVFSQLNLSLSYHHLSDQITKRYDLFQAPIVAHLEENKISLQARAYKNLNPSSILFYGSEANLTFMDINFSENTPLKSFLDRPVSAFTSYIKFEKRQSADISWFIGAKGGIENISFSDSPSYLRPVNNFRPQFELNISWLRHICESSNYMINLFLRSKAPKLIEYQPFASSMFYIPNLNLSNEIEFLVESHLYRKFEDKFEVHLSPYFRYSWNTILIQDNYGNSNETIQIGSKTYYTLSYTNHPKIAEGGIQMELKYNVSKKILGYYQMSIQDVWTPLDSNLFYPQLPIYGNIGIKFKSDRWFLHAWTHFNGGCSFSNAANSQYIQYYAQSNGLQKKFPAYFDVNIADQFQATKNITIQMNLENIFDQYSLDFLSILPNAGRRFRLQLTYSL